jgi:hypothetical protein
MELKVCDGMEIWVSSHQFDVPEEGFLLGLMLN